MRNRLQDIAETYDVTYVSKEEILCSQEYQTCPLAIDGKPMNWYFTHFSKEGAKFFSSKMFDIISKEFWISFNRYIFIIPNISST